MKRVIATAVFTATVLSCGIQTTEPIHWEYVSNIPKIEVKEVRPPKIRAKPLVKSENIISTATRVREFDQSDAQLLMRVAQAEAGNQGQEGMELIMEVILNRVNSDSSDFPDTISSVVYQKHQFETVTKGTYLTVDISPEAHLALAEIEKGKEYDENIVAFETSSHGKVLEKYFDYAYTVGDHDFFYKKSE